MPAGASLDAWTLFLRRVRRSVTVGVAPVIGDHVNVRVGATIFRISCANFEYPCRRIRFIDEVMTVGITTPEGRAVAGAQGLFARVGDQCKFAIEYPDELIF